MKLFSKSYTWLFISGLVLILFSFFDAQRPVDIRLQDSLVVMDAFLAFGSAGTALLLFWLLYRLTRKYLYARVLSWVHVVLTIVTVLYFLLNLFGSGLGRTPEEAESFSDVYGFLRAIHLPPLVLAAFLAVQLLYPVNLALGLVRRSRKKRRRVALKRA
ncbi:hypothetical protein V9K67_22655 [Paraflavisolibacter sp. H34]|uniref:hypothetical protein n=1 Tax=Huijunlia imazamoxiresistens TaxID=3127457 RepID=UPI00301A925D